MTAGFVAQTSIKQALVRGFPGMIADGGPKDVVHGLNTSRKVVTVTPTADNDAVYTLTITIPFTGESESFEYTADASATVAEITAGLEALVNASTLQVTATDNTTDLSLQADYYSLEFDFTASGSATGSGALAFATVSEQGGTLADGTLVIFDSSISSDPKAVRHPVLSTEITTATNVAGILLADNYSVRDQDASVGPGMVSIVRKGRVLVKVEQAVSSDAPVYVRYAAGGNGVGSFRADAGSSEGALLNGAVYLNAAAANGLAVVEINVVGG